jgi:hypothetical protein
MGKEKAPAMRLRRDRMRRGAERLEGPAGRRKRDAARFRSDCLEKLF